MPNIKINKAIRKANIKTNECVACGSCVMQCPKSAIHIEKGLFAQIDAECCIGCGKCVAVCPASVMALGEVS